MKFISLRIKYLVLFSGLIFISTINYSCSKKSDKNSNTNIFTHKPEFQVEGIYYNAGGYTKFEYDSQGRIVKTYNQQNNSSTYQYSDNEVIVNFFTPTNSWEETRTYFLNEYGYAYKLQVKELTPAGILQSYYKYYKYNSSNFCIKYYSGSGGNFDTTYLSIDNGNCIKTKNYTLQLNQNTGKIDTNGIFICEYYFTTLPNNLISIIGPSTIGYIPFSGNSIFYDLDCFLGEKDKNLFYRFRFTDISFNPPYGNDTTYFDYYLYSDLLRKYLKIQPLLLIK